MDGILAGQQADARPLRERLPTMTGTAIAPELRQRGLKDSGSVVDLRARLLSWLDIEEAGKQKLRSVQQRRDELAHLTMDEMLREIQNRGLLAPVGKAFGSMKREELVELLAAFHSTPHEFIVESDRLGWSNVPQGYEHSPLPAFPNRVGPRLPCDSNISELDAFLLLFGIPEALRARFDGHENLIDLMVREHAVVCVRMFIIVLPTLRRLQKRTATPHNQFCLTKVRCTRVASARATTGNTAGPSLEKSCWRSWVFVFPWVLFVRRICTITGAVTHSCATRVSRLS